MKVEDGGKVYDVRLALTRRLISYILKHESRLLLGQMKSGTVEFNFGPEDMVGVPTPRDLPREREPRA